MDLLPDQVLRDFTAFYDNLEQFLANATPAMDLSPLEERLPANYQKTFCVTGMDEPAICTRETAMAGLRQMIEAGNKVRIENRTIRMRTSTEAVVFLERVLEKGGQPLARVFHVETWRLVDGEWMMIRETMEQVTA